MKKNYLNLKKGSTHFLGLTKNSKSELGLSILEVLVSVAVCGIAIMAYISSNNKAMFAQKNLIELNDQVKDSASFLPAIITTSLDFAIVASANKLGRDSRCRGVTNEDIINKVNFFQSHYDRAGLKVDLTTANCSNANNTDLKDNIKFYQGCFSYSSERENDTDISSKKLVSISFSYHFYNYVTGTNLTCEEYIETPYEERGAKLYYEIHGMKSETGSLSEEPTSEQSSSKKLKNKGFIYIAAGVPYEKLLLRQYEDIFHFLYGMSESDLTTYNLKDDYAKLQTLIKANITAIIHNESPIAVINGTITSGMIGFTSKLLANKMYDMLRASDLFKDAPCLQNESGESSFETILPTIEAGIGGQGIKKAINRVFQQCLSGLFLKNYKNDLYTASDLLELSDTSISELNRFINQFYELGYNSEQTTWDFSNSTTTLILPVYKDNGKVTSDVITLTDLTYSELMKYVLKKYTAPDEVKLNYLEKLINRLNRYYFKKESFNNAFHAKAVSSLFGADALGYLSTRPYYSRWQTSLVNHPATWEWYMSRIVNHNVYIYNRLPN